MKAKITKHASNARNYYGEKELVGHYSVVANSPNGPIEIVTARAWMGRSRNASTVYASIWVKSKSGDWTSGTGKAGGYGYHKESAAFQEAIDSAGIELFGDVYGREKTNKHADISGVGTSAMHDAFLAIARAAGYRGKLSII